MLTHQLDDFPQSLQSLPGDIDRIYAGELLPQDHPLSVPIAVVICHRTEGVAECAQAPMLVHVESSGPAKIGELVNNVRSIPRTTVFGYEQLRDIRHASGKPILDSRQRLRPKRGDALNASLAAAVSYHAALDMDRAQARQVGWPYAAVGREQDHRSHLFAGADVQQSPQFIWRHHAVAAWELVERDLLPVWTEYRQAFNPAMSNGVIEPRIHGAHDMVPAATRQTTFEVVGGGGKDGGAQLSYSPTSADIANELEQGITQVGIRHFAKCAGHDLGAAGVQVLIAEVAERPSAVVVWMDGASNLARVELVANSLVVSQCGIAADAMPAEVEEPAAYFLLVSPVSAWLGGEVIYGIDAALALSHDGSLTTGSEKASEGSQLAVVNCFAGSQENTEPRSSHRIRPRSSVGLERWFPKPDQCLNSPQFTHKNSTSDADASGRNASKEVKLTTTATPSVVSLFSPSPSPSTAGAL
jgi:hypothetical protein